MANGDSYTLIQTKLHIPHINTELVLRPRLIKSLNEGLETNDSTDGFQPYKRKLTLVTAPAGYGHPPWLHHGWTIPDVRPLLKRIWCSRCT